MKVKNIIKRFVGIKPQHLSTTKLSASLILCFILLGVLFTGVSAGATTTDVSENITAEQSPESVTASPGEEVTITATVSTNSNESISLVEGRFDSNLTIVEGSSTQSQFIGNDATYEVIYLSPVDEDTIEYTVEVPDNATTGTEYTLNGTVIGSSEEKSIGETIISVEPPTPTVERSPTTTTASPGSEVDITLNLSSVENDSLISITENIGQNIKFSGGNSEKSQLTEQDGELTVVYVQPVQQDTVEYTVTIPENAETNSKYNISGTVTTNSVVEYPTNKTTISVTRDTAEKYTNDQGETTTSSLREAIEDWRNGSADTTTLREVISNWRAR